MTDDTHRRLQQMQARLDGQMTAALSGVKDAIAHLYDLVNMAQEWLPALEA